MSPLDELKKFAETLGSMQISREVWGELEECCGPESVERDPEVGVAFRFARGGVDDKFAARFRAPGVMHRESSSSESVAFHVNGSSMTAKVRAFWKQFLHGATLEPLGKGLRSVDSAVCENEPGQSPFQPWVGHFAVESGEDGLEGGEFAVHFDKGSSRVDEKKEPGCYSGLWPATAFQVLRCQEPGCRHPHRRGLLLFPRL